MDGDAGGKTWIQTEYDLLEGIVLHAFEGKAPFSEQNLEKIRTLKQVFGLDLKAEDSHLLVELTQASSRKRSAPPKDLRIAAGKGKGVKHAE